MLAEQYEHRWIGRPVLGALVAATSFLLPIVVSVAAAVAISRVLPHPDGTVETLLWWGAITAVTVLALVVVDRAARRLLPLAALLRMSMLFPDRAPSRFRVAFRAGTVRALERRVQYARSHGLDDEPAKAAETILTLAAALSAHDRKTRGHSERVRAFTDLLAAEMKLPPDDRDRLRWAALLHDIGKLGVSPAILNKAGEPDEDEWAVIHRHPEEGARLVAPLRAWLGEWAPAIEHHHEKWDGTGYPFGLAGDDISLGARVVAVADSYEVMTAVRSYKKSLSAADARRELAACAGSHFDPAVVRAFLNIAIGRLRWAMGPIAWLVELPFVGGLPRAALAPVAQGNGAATAVMGGSIAAATLGLAGIVATENPTPATAGERPVPAVEQVVELPDDDGRMLDRLPVGGLGSMDPIVTGGPGGGEGDADVTTVPEPADSMQVLGESYEAPRPGDAGGDDDAGGGDDEADGDDRDDGDGDDGDAPTATTTTPVPATERSTGVTTTTTQGDGGSDGPQGDPECQATERGLERGAADDHPFCDFRGERDDD